MLTKYLPTLNHPQRPSTPFAAIELLQYLVKDIIGADDIKQGHRGFYFHGINVTQYILSPFVGVFQECGRYFP